MRLAQGCVGKTNQSDDSSFCVQGLGRGRAHSSLDIANAASAAPGLNKVAKDDAAAASSAVTPSATQDGSFPKFSFGVGAK